MSEMYNELDLSFCGPIAPPKLTLEQKLGPDLAWLVRSAPNAPHTFGALRSRNIYVPPETEDVVKWIEDNYHPPIPVKAPVNTAVPRRRNYLMLEGSYEATEYGRVPYNRNVYGSISYRVDLGELEEMASRATSRSNLIEQLESLLESDGERETINYGDIEYGDEDSEGEENEEYAIDLKDFLEEWLDDNPEYDPEREVEEDDEEEDDEPEADDDDDDN